MKKRGFTLIELLVIIVLIGIVAAIAVTGILGNQKRLLENLFCEKIELIEQGAILWGQDNTDLVADGDTVVKGEDNAISIDITVKRLIEEDYLKSEVEDELSIPDPRDGSVKLEDEKIEVYMKNQRIYADYYFTDEDKEMCK